MWSSSFRQKGKWFQRLRRPSTETVWANVHKTHSKLKGMSADVDESHSKLKIMSKKETELTPSTSGINHLSIDFTTELKQERIRSKRHHFSTETSSLPTPHADCNHLFPALLLHQSDSPVSQYPDSLQIDNYQDSQVGSRQKFNHKI